MRQNTRRELPIQPSVIASRVQAGSQPCKSRGDSALQNRHAWEAAVRQQGRKRMGERDALILGADQQQESRGKVLVLPQVHRGLLVFLSACSGTAECSSQRRFLDVGVFSVCMAGGLFSGSKASSESEQGKAPRLLLSNASFCKS